MIMVTVTTLLLLLYNIKYDVMLRNANEAKGSQLLIRSLFHGDLIKTPGSRLMLHTCGKENQKYVW